LLKPDSFIGQAERSGAIIPLNLARPGEGRPPAGRLEGTRRAARRGGQHLGAVPRLLKRADEILELLQRERFEPHRLTLEITETKRRAIRRSHARC